MNASVIDTPVPHQEAIDLIRGKAVVSREVFDKLLPEIKARAFVITGLNSLDALQSARDVRDKIADLPRGGSWDEIKKNVAGKISPWLVDANAKPEEQVAQMKGCERRAELLLRTHGFQAYQAASWQLLQRQMAVFPFVQYHSMEDARVRPAHAALNGLIFPSDHPFVKSHWCPWDWGCRCQWIMLSRAGADYERQKHAKRIADWNANPSGEKPVDPFVSDAALGRVENHGMLDLGNGKPLDVRTPVQKGTPHAFSWDPSTLGIPLDQLKRGYAPDVWSSFEKLAKETPLDGNKSMWDWLNDGTVTKGTEHENAALQPQIGNNDAGETDAIQRGRHIEGDLRDLSLRHDGNAGPAEHAPATAAEISAVFDGRKPLYHELMTGHAPEAAALIAKSAPPGIHVESHDDHLYVWNPAAVKSLLDADPAFYRPNGETDAQAVRRAVSNDVQGELMGYGSRALNEPGSVVVHLMARGKVVAGFHAPRDRAEALAAERAKDYADYLGVNIRIVIKDR